MRRTFVIPVAAVVLLAVVGALLTPSLARRYAQWQVDTAFARIREDSTSVVTRGPVTVDIWTWTATVVDVVVVSPGGSTTSIGAIIVDHPANDGERLTARHITLTDVTVVDGDAVSQAPRIDIANYAGPAKGVVSTPGLQRDPRTQASIFSEISFDGATMPTIEITSTVSGVHRTITDFTVDRVVLGIADSARARAVKIAAPDPRPGRTDDERAFELRVADLSFERLAIPAVWRFYAGDPVDDREPVIGRIEAKRFALSTGFAGGVHVALSADRMVGENLKLRPLAFPIGDIDEALTRARSDDPPGPAEIRAQLRMSVDIARAVSIDGLVFETLKGEEGGPGRETNRWSAGSLQIGAYADATLSRVAVKDGAIDAGGRFSGTLGGAEADRLDAASFMEHLGMLGRDEILLTAKPTTEDVIRISPRLTKLGVSHLSLKTPQGSLSLEGGRADADAPRAMVPQKLSLTLAGIDLSAPPGAWLGGLLKIAAVDHLKGAATSTLSLDPNTGVLSLDALDYRFEGLGAIRARGGLAHVDPALAFLTGARFLDKLSLVTLMPFRVSAVNEGLVETVLKRAAEQAGDPVEAFRERTALDVEAQVTRLFGPPAAESAITLADFVRKPEAIEIRVAPRTPGMTLIDFLQSLSLGPVGIAQTIDVQILPKR